MPRVSTLTSPPRRECDGLESPTAASEPSDDIWQLLASPQLLACSGDAAGATAIPLAPRALVAADLLAARDADADAIRTPLAPLPPQGRLLDRQACPQLPAASGDGPGATAASPSAPPRALAAAGPPAASDAGAGAIRTPLAPLPLQPPPVCRPSRGQLLQAAALSTARCAPHGASRHAEVAVAPAAAEYALRRAWHVARNGTAGAENARIAAGPEAVRAPHRAASALPRAPAARYERAALRPGRGAAHEDGHRESCPPSRGMLIYCSIAQGAAMSDVPCTPRTSSQHLGRDGYAAKRARLGGLAGFESLPPCYHDT